MEELLRLSKVWNEIKPLWELCKDAIYDLSLGKTCLGYSPHGCTTYFSKNFTSADNDNVKKWMKKKQLEPYNTRCFKTEKNGKISYEIRLAGVNCCEIESEDLGEAVYSLTSGDYSPLLKKVVEYLQQAIPYSSNETQSNMLSAYIESFTTGSLQKHKEGSRFWIQDKAPVIETYIGFIETYRDPAGIRGEFEGFVASVNRPMSSKFTTLVENAEKFLPLLPWPRGFEKDVFLRPDFTSLDVLTFSGSGIPAGINIPNCKCLIYYLLPICVYKTT